MVLIVSSAKKQAQTISDMFYYMGVLSYAATPSEALTEISGLYRAVIVLEAHTLPDTENYISKMRSYNCSVPIFAISDSDEIKYVSHLFDGCLKDSIYSSTLVEEIVRYQSERRLPLCAHYRLSGIDASCNSEVVTVFDRKILFTKTETMILRYLIASYPMPQNAKSIIKYAFKPTRKPEIASIRTHISVMNKKFKDTTGKLLFQSLVKEGYVISTPEVIKSLIAIN